ncbi:MAG: response regulator [Selenomonadaceae bacterium]|nr:response regulator [Selenomonadaceae bacterium]MBR1860006.1 response regulator [Selenomonadaceae bacterium]
MADTDKLNILIVDDDDMMLKMAEFVLIQDARFNIIKANSGLQCLRTLQSGEKIDLILLDIQMPGMDGIKVMELIQKHDYWKLIPVIFLTAASDKNTVLKAGQMGAVGYVKKPFVPEDLIARVEMAIV